MKKLLALFTILGMLTFGASNIYAQGDVKKAENATEQVATDTQAVAATPVAPVEAAPEEAAPENAPVEEESFHQVLKEQFIEGGSGYMAPVLICLIFGLAICIERIMYLTLSSINSKKFIESIEETLKNGGVEEAKELCRNTRGPIASIFYQGLERIDEGVEMAEKSVIQYGNVIMGRLEKGLSWISLFIALAPMLGFLGTVIGMIQAFDAIAEAGDISPTIVASGIKVALLTTVFGLIVAIILQVFYNYIVGKIESTVNELEDSSIALVDILSKYKSKN